MHFRSLVLAALWLIACASFARAAAPPAADLVILEARVFTMDDARPWAEAVAVRGERLAYVGDATGAQAHIGKRTRVLRLPGRFVVPGFVDAHDHTVLGPILHHGVDLEGVESTDAALERIRAWAAANPDERIVRGYGWSPGLFDEHGPRKELLDGIVADRPAVLFDHDSHTIWMNSRALEVAGFGQRETTPAELVPFIFWNADGTPTGGAVEPPAIITALAAVQWVELPGTLDDALRRTVLRVPEYGITTIYDAAVMLPGREDPEGDAFGMLARLEREHRLPVRITGSVVLHPGADAGEAVQRIRALDARFRSQQLSIRTLKILVDGASTYRTGSMLTPYLDGTHGLEYHSAEALTAAVLAADDAGYSVHLHVDGTAAVRHALDAIERAKAARGSLRAKHTLCHVSLMDEADAPRFAALGVHVNSTPVWASNIDGWYQHMDRVLSAEVTRRAFAYRTLLRNGAELSFGADLPSSAERDLAPLRQMQYAVTRRPIETPERGFPPSYVEAITVAEALRAYTLGGAIQLQMQDQIGSLVEGKRADLVVLGHDPFAVDAALLHAVPVEMTLMNGRFTHGGG